MHVSDIIGIVINIINGFDDKMKDRQGLREDRKAALEHFIANKINLIERTYRLASEEGESFPGVLAALSPERVDQVYDQFYEFIKDASKAQVEGYFLGLSIEQLSFQARMKKRHFCLRTIKAIKYLLETNPEITLESAYLACRKMSVWQLNAILLGFSPEDAKSFGYHTLSYMELLQKIRPRITIQEAFEELKNLSPSLCKIVLLGIPRTHTTPIHNPQKLEQYFVKMFICRSRETILREGIGSCFLDSKAFWVQIEKKLMAGGYDEISKQATEAIQLAEKIIPHCRTAYEVQCIHDLLKIGLSVKQAIGWLPCWVPYIAKGVSYSCLVRNRDLDNNSKLLFYDMVERGVAPDEAYVRAGKAAFTASAPLSSRSDTVASHLIGAKAASIHPARPPSPPQDDLGDKPSAYVPS